MKSRIVFICFFFVLSFGAKGQYVTIPDTNFVSYLQAFYPSCMSGNQMDTTCPAIQTATGLGLNGGYFYDLTGVEYFINLEHLYCSGNQLTSLPPLPNTLLTLDCSANLLTSLPSLSNTITYIDCATNQLTSLPTLPTSLMELDCSINMLATFPLMPNSLIELDCHNNQLVTLPSLSTSLDRLLCFNNSVLTSLPALPNSLTELRCYNTPLTSLPALPNSLITLNTGNNLLTSLPSLPNSLGTLYCYSNLLTSLPPLPNSLFVIGCFNNQLTSLPSLPNALLTLNCLGNFLTSLPPLPNTITSLSFDFNNISCLGTFPNSINTLTCTANPFTCLPNYISSMDSVLLSFPLCVSGDTINNINGCVGAQGVAGQIYRDNNSNCSIDGGDQLLSNIPIKILDVSGTQIGASYSLLNGIYNFSDSTGISKILVDTTGMPYQAQCSYPGIDSTVILSASSPLASNIDFDIACKPGFDVGVQSVVPSGWVFPGLQHDVRIVAGDLSQWYNLNCASGVSGQVQITMTGPISYFGVQTGALIPSVAGNVFTYSISDFDLINNLQNFGLVFTTDTSASIGDQVCVNIVVTPFISDNDTSNNSYQFCYDVLNSYDPNMKEVYPVNVSTGFQDWFTYTIHFQNTGTAPAINIRLEDSLDNNLDLETFQVINYSHLNVTSLSGNVMTVRFPNIMLPDSTMDLDGSQGYIQYRIKPKSGLPIGTQITNTAYIYFDYNSPIITNTTVNTYTSPASINEEVHTTRISIFPNPSNGIYTIKLSENNNNAVFDVEIVNLLGESVMHVVGQKNLTQIDLSNKPNGVYFVKINNDGQSQTKRIIKQ